MMHSKRPSQASVNQSSESSKALSTSSPSVSASAVNPTATATNAGAAAPAAPVTATTPPTARPPKPTSPPPQYTLQLSPQSPRATTTSSSSASQETTAVRPPVTPVVVSPRPATMVVSNHPKPTTPAPVPHVGSGDASAVARVVQLSARGPTSPHRFSGVEPLLVGQDKTTVVEKVFVPPCTIVYRFENSGSLSVVNMLTQRATLLPPYPSPAIQLAVAPPYVVSLHADDTLLFYDVHTASPHWSKSLRCADVFAEDDESVGSESVSSPSTAGDDDVNAVAKRVLVLNEVWICVISKRRIGLWSWARLLTGGTTHRSSTSSASNATTAAAAAAAHAAAHAHAGLSESDNVMDSSNDYAIRNYLAGGMPFREIAVEKADRRLQLRAPLCSVDESGRVVLGSREAFTVYDARHGIAMYRFRVKGTLPPHFTAIRWSGECVVTLEQRGVRVFRVLPLLSDTNGVLAVNDELTAAAGVQLGNTKSARDAPSTVVESRLAPLVTPAGGAQFTSLLCTAELAVLGDSLGQLYRLPLIDSLVPIDASGKQGVVLVAGDDDNYSYAEIDESFAIQMVASPEFAALRDAMQGNKLEPFKNAVNNLADSTLLLGYHGTERESALHVAADTDFVEAIKWLAKKYAFAIDQVRGDGRTALHCAAATGFIASCNALLDAGATSLIPDKDGALAAHLFCSVVWKKQHADESAQLLERLLPSADLERGDKFGYTALHYAVVAQNEAAIFELLDRGACASTIESKSDNTILHTAVATGSGPVVDLLLEWAVPLRATNKKGLLASEMARANNMLEVAAVIEKATFLAATGKRTRRRPARGTAPFSEDIATDEITVRPITVQAMTSPISLPLSPAVAASPVALADGKPRSSIGKLLRRVRGDSAAATSQSPPATPPSATTSSSAATSVTSPSTPDSQATPEAKAVLVAAKSSLDDLKALGKKSVALLYTATDRLQQTALHIAAFNDRVESVRWLLANKKCPPEFVNAVDKNGQTALHVAASAKSLGSCVALMEGGASAAALDSKMTTPFHYAARSPALLPVMPAMLNGGVRLDARDEKGDTPIFQAAFKGAVQVVDWLLLHGASLSTQNLVGENCLHAAARSGDVAVVKLLLDRGVPPAVRALDVGTPRDVAIACNNTDIVAAFDTYRHLQHASKKKKRHNRPVTTQVPLDNAAQTFARTVAGTLHTLDGSRTGSGTTASAPICHIGRLADRLSVVSTDGAMALYELATDRAKPAKLVSTFEGLATTTPDIVAEDRGTLMVGTPARGKLDVAVVSYVSEPPALEGLAERIVAANELSIFIDLDVPICDEPFTTAWSEYSLSSRARPVVGFVSTTPKQAIADIDLCSRTTAVAAWGSLTRPPLPFDRRATMLSTLLQSGRMHVGTTDEELSPVIAIASNQLFRFAYLIWRPRELDERALPPATVIEAIEHAAAGLLTVGGKLSLSNSSGSRSGQPRDAKVGAKKDKKKEK